jgi:CDP-diacylglycerol--serine O-phosphatidyltransferase
MKTYLFIIILPLVLSNIIHMVIVKMKVLSVLDMPISESLFGQNKTWRGMIVVTLLNAFILLLVGLFYQYLSPWQAFGSGLLLGFTYMVFELPNSWLKRKVGIASGERPTNAGWMYMVLDKTDSSFGISLVSWVIFNLSYLHVLELFLIASLTHASFSWLLVISRLKKSF